MIDSNIRDQLLDELDRLAPSQQRRVLDFARGLAEGQPARPGVPGKELLRFVGIIDSEEAQAMRDAIEAACERIDQDR